MKYILFLLFLSLFSMASGVKAEEKKYVCEYKTKDASGNYIKSYGITIRYEPGSFESNNPFGCDNTYFVEKDQIHNQSCPEKLYYVLYSDPETKKITECYYYLQSKKNAKELDLISSEEISLEEDENIIPDRETGAPTVGCGILGNTNGETAKLLSWIIKLIRFGVPVLIIILGATDFLKILFSGEEKVFKEAFSKFAKRIAIGMTMIFVPYILYLMVKLSGVDVQYNIDNLYCGILETTSGVKNNEIDNYESNS